jgi:hypothetical protein
MTSVRGIERDGVVEVWLLFSSRELVECALRRVE